MNPSLILAFVATLGPALPAAAGVPWLQAQAAAADPAAPSLPVLGQAISQATDGTYPGLDMQMATDLAPVPGQAGAYLAARQAAAENDFAAAAQYFSQAVEADPGDEFLQDGAIVSLVSAGMVDKAVALADRIEAAGGGTELSALLRRVDRAKAGDWPTVLDMLDSMPSDPSAGGPLLDGLFRAWALMGAGRAGDAFALLDKMAAEPGAGGMAHFQLALAKASVGDYEGAALLLEDPVASTHLQGLTARAQVLSQLERNDQALALFEPLDRIEDEPQLAALRDRLAAGERVPFDVVTDAREGLAQVLVTFGGALMGGQETDPLALLYARLAQYLDPQEPDARLLSAQLLMNAGQFDLAEREYDALRESGQMRPVSELARIDTLARADRLDAAESAARALTENYPQLAQGWVALGDVLRQRDSFAEAVPVYDRALDILRAHEAPQASWFALYARGISKERSGDYDGADADFQAALELQPDQAPVLNYLGYSWVDRNIRLDEALRLIERAVELRPDDGYILDSLAWAYYRLGRYADAVAPMERAVAVMSEDSLVNDHMGDIYWMAGRKREAEIQWQRAQSLYKPSDTDTDLPRIRAKLHVGLDAVLKAEADNGGTLPEGFGLPPEPEPPAAPDMGAETGGETGQAAPDSPSDG